MTERIASDSTLTTEQRRTLHRFLDLLIPADAGKGMPSAGQLDFMGYVAEFAADRIPSIQREIDGLNEAARKRHGTAFVELTESEQQVFCDQLFAANPRLAPNIQSQLLNCYYQDDTVVTALGMEARPPFPKGNTVDRGDLSLLDPVRQRAQIYRD
jgi:hypothetical protein